jgi:hypothetical protein
MKIQQTHHDNRVFFYKSLRINIMGELLINLFLTSLNNPYNSPPLGKPKGMSMPQLEAW